MAIIPYTPLWMYLSCFLCTVDRPTGRLAATLTRSTTTRSTCSLPPTSSRRWRRCGFRRSAASVRTRDAARLGRRGGCVSIKTWGVVAWLMQRIWWRWRWDSLYFIPSFCQSSSPFWGFLRHLPNQPLPIPINLLFPNRFWQSTRRSTRGRRTGTPTRLAWTSRPRTTSRSSPGSRC